MNEGDNDYCALYVDNNKVYEEYGQATLVEDVLSKLVGVTVESVSIEYTNLPFYLEDETPLDKHEWPATIDDLPEGED